MLEGTSMRGVWQLSREKGERSAADVEQQSRTYRAGRDSDYDDRV